MANITLLDSNHYASKWPLPKESEFNNLQVVNQLGITYAQSPDGLEKEELLLEIVKCFHGYVFKYTDLIVRGHLPTHQYNGDTRRFLRYFLPKDSIPSKAAFSKAAHHLHLAFPQQTTSDIYDTLNILLLRCVKKYDPDYVIKVQDVVKVINKLLKKKYITIEEVKSKLKFEALGAIRLLARKGYIKAIRGNGKKLLGYKVTKEWPPSKEFLSSGPVGFVYFVQTWFRYYLQEHIDEQTNTIEAKAWDKMLQLEHRTVDNDAGLGHTTPHTEGDMIDSDGSRWAADMVLVNKSFDISHMNGAWVESTNDKFFTNMTKRERHLLYLYYVQELPWKQIATHLEMSINQVQKIHAEIITYLQGKFNVQK